MSEKSRFADKDAIERFKPYIEIVKYAISVVIALAAVCGLMLRIGAPGQGSVGAIPLAMFVFGILLNISLFFVCHRVVAEATSAITHEMGVDERAGKLASINDRSYSVFAILFLFSLAYWSVAIGVVVVT